MDTPGEVALVLLGALLVLLALADAVVTTLGAGLGGGLLTLRLAHLTGRLLRLLGRGPLRGLLVLSGPLVLLVTVLTWVLLLWAGWTLVLSGAELAVVDATSGVPADLAERIYFTGYVIFTLGLGDFRPETGGWQVLTALASFVGLFVVTLSITYLVSVVSAAVSRRALAREVGLSGSTGAEVVLLHWDGEQVSSFSEVAQSLGSQLLAVAEQHLAYPVLHSFSAADPQASAPRALAALDDAVLLLRSGLQEPARPPLPVLVRLERALLHHARNVGGTAGGRCDPPPPPDLQPLRAAGLPVVDDGAFRAAVERDGSRRARLRALLEADGHTWPEVSG